MKILYSLKIKIIFSMLSREARKREYLKKNTKDKMFCIKTNCSMGNKMYKIFVNIRLQLLACFVVGILANSFETQFRSRGERSISPQGLSMSTDFDNKP